MNKTKIEWCDYTWNPVKGECPNDCWYCYMKGINRRFKRDPKLRLDEKELLKPIQPCKPGRIFVGSTIDLFHPKIPNQWIQKIIEVCDFVGRGSGNDIFIFLTKFPARYAEFDFPKNCWLGVTVTKNRDLWRIEATIDRFFQGIKKSKILRNKIFVSIEPLLEDLDLAPLTWPDWIIMGRLTGPQGNQYLPKEEWIGNIINRAKNTPQCDPIPIFMKDNLKKVWGKKLIQEFPK